MSQNPTAAEQHQQLVAQEQTALVAKARLLEQLEATNAQLSAIRAALSGAQLGFTVAQEAVEKSSDQAAPAPDKE